MCGPLADGRFGPGRLLGAGATAEGVPAKPDEHHHGERYDLGQRVLKALSGESARQ